MFERVRVVGRGRVGTAVKERLRERQVAVDDDGADLVLLCVPDPAIRESAGPRSRRIWQKSSGARLSSRRCTGFSPR